MSNGRKHPSGRGYRLGYLRSVTWLRRRERWFVEQQQRTGGLQCIVCWRPARQRQLELHHLDYRNVGRGGTTWRSHERHEELCAMHPGCHELVHRILDADPVLRHHRTRPIATVHAIRAARQLLTRSRRSRS
jgi:hypothetical protein